MFEQKSVARFEPDPVRFAATPPRSPPKLIAMTLKIAVADAPPAIIIESSRPETFRALPISTLGLRGPFQGSVRHVIPLDEVQLVATEATPAHFNISVKDGHFVLPLCAAYVPGNTASFDLGTLRCLRADTREVMGSTECEGKIIVPGVAVVVSSVPPLPRHGNVAATITVTNDSQVVAQRKISVSNLPPNVSFELLDAHLIPVEETVSIAPGASLSLQLHLNANGATSGRYNPSVVCRAVGLPVPRRESAASLSESEFIVDNTSFSLSGPPIDANATFDLLVESEAVKLFAVVDGLTSQDLLAFEDVANGQTSTRSFTVQNISTAALSIETLAPEVENGHVSVRLATKVRASGLFHTRSSLAPNAPKRENDSTEQAHITSLSDDSGEDNDGDDESCTGGVLLPGSYAVISVEFTPTIEGQTGVKNAEFSVSVVAVPASDRGSAPRLQHQQKMRVKCTAFIHSGRIAVSRHEVSFGTATLGAKTTTDLAVVNPSQVSAAVTIMCRSKIITIDGSEPDSSGNLNHRLIIPPSSSHTLTLCICPRRVNPRYRKQLTITSVTNPLDHIVVDLDSNNVQPDEGSLLVNWYTCEEVQYVKRNKDSTPASTAGSPSGGDGMMRNAPNPTRPQITSQNSSVAPPLAGSLAGHSSPSAATLDVPADRARDLPKTTSSLLDLLAEDNAAEIALLRRETSQASTPTSRRPSFHILPADPLDSLDFQPVSSNTTHLALGGFPLLRLFRIRNLREDELHLTLSTTSRHDITLRQLSYDGRIVDEFLERYQFVTNALLMGDAAAAAEVAETVETLRRTIDSALPPADTFTLVTHGTAIVVVSINRTLSEPPPVQFTTFEDTLTLVCDDREDVPPRYVRLPYKVCATLLDVADQQLNKNFGRVNLGEKRPMKVKLQNPSQVPLHLRLTKSKKVSAGDLKIEEIGSADVGFVVVAPLRSYDLHITVAPTIRGAFQESLSIVDVLRPTAAVMLTMKADVEKLETFDVAPTELDLTCAVKAGEGGESSPIPTVGVDGTAIAIATGKMSLSNTSKAKRTFIVRCGPEGPLRHDDIDVRLRLDIEIVGAAANSKAKLEDEIERLDRKLKIYRRKNKAEKAPRRSDASPSYAAHSRASTTQAAWIASTTSISTERTLRSRKATTTVKVASRTAADRAQSRSRRRTSPVRYARASPCRHCSPVIRHNSR
jgi:hypothetical protein